MTQSINYQKIINDQLSIPSMLLKQFHTLGLDEIDVILLLQIHRFHVEGNSFPTPVDLAQYLTINEQECSNRLRKLIQLDILSINQLKNEQNILDEHYSLENLWIKLYHEEPKETPSSNSENEQTNIFILFEQEFGRPLSPFEIETINIWMDEEEQLPSLIKAALRESVLMGKLNFKYIDRILREWKRKGIRSVDQARKQSKNYHVNQRSKQKKENSDKNSNEEVSLYYNWLEED